MFIKDELTINEGLKVNIIQFSVGKNRTLLH